MFEPPPSTAEIKLNEIVSAAMGEEAPALRPVARERTEAAAPAAPAEAPRAEEPQAPETSSSPADRAAEAEEFWDSVRTSEAAAESAPAAEPAEEAPAAAAPAEEVPAAAAPAEEAAAAAAPAEVLPEVPEEEPSEPAVEEEPGEEESESREAEDEDLQEDVEEEPEEAEERPRRRRRRRRRRPAAEESPEPAPEAAEAEEAASPAPESEPASPPPLAAVVVREPAAVEAVEGSELAALLEALVSYSPPERGAAEAERNIAVFCDLENLTLGMRESEGKESTKFDIDMVLERLLEKGKVIVKRAYADWQRYSDYKRAFHESAVEMIDIPQKRYSGKNSADIKLAVDAMELCYTKEHMDTFVVVSGDSDFSPLVSKLRENDKYVIGIGMKNSTSALLVGNCDEFIYYEDVWRDAQEVPALDHLEEKKAEVFGLMVDSILALMREGKEVLWGSMIKQTMKRKRPSFSESYYGYGSFSEMLEDAEASRIVKLRRDRRSGSYVVTGFATSG